MGMVIMVEEEKGVEEEEEERPKKNSIKNSIKKRKQDLIERNSPSILSSMRAEQSKAKQSHVVSIHQKSTTKLKAQLFIFLLLFHFFAVCHLHFPSRPTQSEGSCKVHKYMIQVQQEEEK